MNYYYNNFLACYFGIIKICKFLAKKYFWPILYHDIEAYINSYNIYLASKAIKHKPYGNLQFLPIPTN